MKVKIITNIEELPKFSSTEPVFSDIETQQLYLGTRLVQFYQPATDDTIYIVDLAPANYNKETYKENLQKVKDLIMSLHTVWYNGNYDLGTFNISPKKFDDLFYAVKTAYPEFMEFSLDKVSTKLGFGYLYDGLDKKKLQKQGFVLGAYLSQAQLKYSATDVLVLSKIWEDKKVQAVIRDNMAYKVDIMSQQYALVYQQNGLVVNQTMRREKLIEAEKTINELEPILPVGFNPNSYIQVRKLLNTTESDHAALIRLALGEDKQRALYAQTIIDIKRAKKEFSYLESINFPRMYTKYNVAGAITGRFTSKGGDLPDGFNAQQIPRQFQQIFLQDTEDTTVVHLDYSTLELRLACTIFNEPEMYNQLIKGEDLHTAMAITATGKPLHPDGKPIGSDYEAIGVIDTTSAYVTKKDRQDAKSINFGFVFGMSAKRYVEYAYTQFGIKVSLDQATKLREAYFSKYKGFKKYHDYVWKNYQRPDFTYSTALGRKVKPKSGTDGINGPVQGSGSETTKLAVHYLVQAYPEALKLIFNVVHDAIYLRVPKEDKQLWHKRVAHAMVKGWEEISKTKIFVYKDIPMPVE